MKKAIYKIWAKFLMILGDIKIFKWPFWLVYDPDDYQITGKQILDIMEILKPGDIILRGYRHYLDGKFIPNFKNEDIGIGFSHGAIYIGNNTVIHAIAEGVSKISIIDFCQCDRIAIFRAKSGAKKAVSTAKKYESLDTPYDFMFKHGSSAIYCFELCHLCYPNIDIFPKTIKKLFGLIKKEVYVALSFIDAEKLNLIYCWNPKSDIDYKATVI